MSMKSRPGGRADAEDEPVAFRSLAAICAVHLDRDGSRHQARRSRAAALRAVRIRLLHGGAIRVGLRDAFRTRVDGGESRVRIDILWIAAGLGCGGDTIAITAAAPPGSGMGEAHGGWQPGEVQLARTSNAV